MNKQNFDGSAAKNSASMPDIVDLPSKETTPHNASQKFEHFEFKLPQSQGGGKAVAPSKLKVKGNVPEVNKEYLKRRNRNNIAVKKSREKSKQKGDSTTGNIERLKIENVELQETVEVLNKELSVLKKVFMDHARGFAGGDTQLPDLQELEQLLGYKLTEKSPGQLAKESKTATNVDTACSSNNS